ncbi:hypothetical protein DM02DRAFT_202020 [Periconia macrospinosa]|uniref:Uncharacterized protein n=1 Tax=Periconia macrospinosa TaxID=97972 RepID=A0A2V1E388_9PLEO|nr:hypothetical protein DM02DRAFT_202020 [Periconia macrospinosa]
MWLVFLLRSLTLSIASVFDFRLLLYVSGIVICSQLTLSIATVFDFSQASCFEHLAFPLCCTREASYCKVNNKMLVKTYGPNLLACRSFTKPFFQWFS